MQWMQNKQLSVYVMHVELICTDDNKNAHVFTYVYTMSSMCMFLKLIMCLKLNVVLEPRASSDIDIH